ncbi:hypothetical protein BJ170DRAFT_24376 [Xylariales sp. AK1849]|nr:hypothetical protein BJ170DRAFT_24376 [Xylariales sp. AK1849]
MSAASRQRSCDECVRGKRRCDKRTPACTRCTKKKFLCIYRGQADMRAFPIDGCPMDLDALAAPLTSQCQDPTGLNSINFASPLDPSIGLSPSATFQFDTAFDNLLNAMPGTGFTDDSWQSSLLRQQTQLAGMEEETMLTRTDYSKMNHMCDDYSKSCLIPS